MTKNKTPKEITQKQLVRIFKDIQRLKSDDTRFCFLIGAGASISSGIPSGWELSRKWYEELKEELKDSEEVKSWVENIGVEFNKDNIGRFYPYLYEKRYESSPQIGYEEFKRVMEDKDPSIGYIILANLLVEEKHNFVITTNFDYLIEDAIRMYTFTKPFIAGHETLAEFISTQTERPTIIKVHRDLFLHPFNDNEETCSLKEEWKNALSPILKNCYLLVLGYGGNDGSLMDYLTELEGENRKPIYWCVRNTDELHGKITDLLTPKDYIVKIRGFDELMYALYGALDYTIFDELDKPDGHQFVKQARDRVLAIDEKLKKLTKELTKEKEEIISEDVKNIIKGASSYLLEAHSKMDNKEKENIFLEGLKKYPDDPYLSASYASFLYDVERIEEGNKNYKKALEIKPDYHEALFNWGTDLGILADKKEGEEAEELYRLAFEKYEKALEIKPDDHEALFNWGAYLGKLAEKKEGEEAEELFRLAFEKYEKALEIKPDDHQALYNWGTALGKLTKKKEAEEAEELFRLAFKKYKKALEIKPDDHEALSNWGTGLGNLAEKKEGEEAEELFRLAFKKYKKALEIKPDDHQALDNWGTYLGILADKKEGEEAEELFRLAFEKYEKALEIKPDDHQALYNWGTYLGILADKKEGEEAEELFRLAFEKYEKAFEIKPDDHEALYNWGTDLGKLAEKKEDEEAEELYRLAFEKYEKALEIKPDDHEALFNWGTDLGKLAEKKEGEEAEELFRLAFEKFRKALEIKPNKHEALGNWGIILLRLAKIKESAAADILLEEAKDKFEKVYELIGQCYNLACLYSTKNEKEKALDYLEISLTSKEVSSDFVENDEDWKSLKDDEDFIKIINKYREK